MSSTQPRSPASRRLRQGRISIPNQTYHLRFGTWQRTRYFDDLRSARLIVRELQRAQTRNEAETLAYVVMPDHVHWLCALGTGKDLAGLMNAIKGRSTKALYGLSDFRHRPRVWQRGYFDRALRRQEDVAALARYIVNNPIRAGLVSRLGDYPHWDLAWLDDRGGHLF